MSCSSSSPFYPCSSGLQRSSSSYAHIGAPCSTKLTKSAWPRRWPCTARPADARQPSASAPMSAPSMAMWSHQRRGRRRRAARDPHAPQHVSPPAAVLAEDMPYLMHASAQRGCLRLPGSSAAAAASPGRLGASYRKHAGQASCSPGPRRLSGSCGSMASGARFAPCCRTACAASFAAASCDELAGGRTRPPPPLEPQLAAMGTRGGSGLDRVWKCSLCELEASERAPRMCVCYASSVTLCRLCVHVVQAVSCGG